MSTLEDLVPPLELCQRIPEGCFEDSAMVWVIKAQEEPEVWERDRTNNIPLIWSKIPAPTLQEILDDLPDRTSIEWRDSSPKFVMLTPFMDETPASDNGAEASLRLWLEVEKKGTEE